MPKQRLRAALDELDATLREGGELDEADIAMLHELHSDIERVLDSTEERQGPKGPVAQAEVGDAITRFEVDHPQLTAVLNRIALALTALGI